MSADFRLGIQSYCFRKFLSLPDLIQALKEAGLSYVEIWPRHLSYELDRSEQHEALSTLKVQGITVDSYGQVRFGDDEAEARSVFEFAKLAGISAITSDVDEEAIPVLEALTEEYGIRIAVHNHGRNHRYGRFDQLDAIFGKTSDRFGLCADTAWFLDADCEPLEAISRYGSRVFGVHLKDFVFDGDGKPEDVILGTGGLDLPQFMKDLDDIGFDGYCSIEYEGDADNPLPKVKECVQVVEEVIAAL
jgi:inosose dehydratase